MEYFIRNVKAGDEIDLTRATAMYKRLLDESIGNGYIMEVNEKPHCIAWWDRGSLLREKPVKPNLKGTETFSNTALLMC